jgi:hypothetical protein
MRESNNDREIGSRSLYQKSEMFHPNRKPWSSLFHSSHLMDEEAASHRQNGSIALFSLPEREYASHRKEKRFPSAERGGVFEDASHRQNGRIALSMLSIGITEGSHFRHFPSAKRKDRTFDASHQQNGRIELSLYRKGNMLPTRRRKRFPSAEREECFPFPEGEYASHQKKKTLPFGRTEGRLLFTSNWLSLTLLEER